MDGTADSGTWPFESPPSLSAEYFRYWILDHANQRVRIILQDGRETNADFGPQPHTEMKQKIFDWEKWWVMSITKQDDLIIASAYNPNSPPPLRGPPTVYLDQNHWSTLALAQADAARVSPADMVAAERIRELALDGGIVLPVSSATLTETARLFGKRRYDVGVTIAQLAGGWQLRHPLQIRRQEFSALFAAEFGLELPRESTLPVVSLEPYSCIDGDTRAHSLDPNDQALFLLALSGPSVLADLLIEPEPTKSAVLATWGPANEQISSEIAALPTPQRRPAAYEGAWRDNAKSIADGLAILGQPLERLAPLTVSDIPRLLRSMPMVGLFTEMMVRRHLEVGRRWRGNDLTDMMFLTAGAAYCDYVVAERSTGSQLDQVLRSMGRPRNTTTSLPALVERLEADGVRTVSERAT